MENINNTNNHVIGVSPTHHIRKSQTIFFICDILISREGNKNSSDKILAYAAAIRRDINRPFKFVCDGALCELTGQHAGPDESA